MALPTPPSAPPAARQRSFIGTILFSLITLGIGVWAIRTAGGTIPGLAGVPSEPAAASPLSTLTAPVSGYAHAHPPLFGFFVFLFLAGLAFWETEVAPRGLRIGLYIALGAVWAVFNAPVLAHVYHGVRGMMSA